MIQLTEKQLSRFADHIREKFLKELVEVLSKSYPEFLPRFPQEIRIRIAHHLAARAEAVGATWQSAIANWCALMISTAPNLHRDPAVWAWLNCTGSTPDSTITNLHNRLTEADWKRVEQNRCDLELFTSPEMDEQPLQKRIASALPLLLWDFEGKTDFDALAAQAIAYAARLGMSSFMDAPLTLAVFSALYANAADLAQKDWLKNIVDATVPPRSRLEMLRTRIMIDHGRWS